MKQPGKVHWLDQLRQLGHLEQEVKLEVGADWAVPDLNGVIPGARAIARPTLSLETVYYDTADLRLDAQHLTLRYRRESEAPARPGRRPARGPGPAQDESRVWTIKLPSATEDDSVLARTELNWAADAAGRGRRNPPVVPDEAAEFLAGVTVGRPLQPVARLSTTRQRTELRTSDGRVLAEVDHDTVEGANLTVPAGPVVVFTEVEVELAEGSALEVLEAVAARLVKAGARPSRRLSKLATVLHSQAAPPASLNGTGKAKARSTMADILQQQARSCLAALVDHDPPIRLGASDPEHVHRSRVATRRFRSLLRAVAPQVLGVERYFDDEADDDAARWLGWLQGELRWLGEALGRARDADVRLQWLEAQGERLGTLDGPGAARVLEAAKQDQRSAHEELLQDMRERRYIELLRALEAVCRPRPNEEATPPAAPGTIPVPEELWRRLAQPAATVLPSLGRRHWRSLRKAIGRLPDDPPDAALHRVRIKAKRFRYVSEFAAPVLRPPARRRSAERAVAAATELQDTLGAVHDAAVNQRWLREVASPAPSRTTRAQRDEAVLTALAVGQLAALAREAELAGRATWRTTWRRLEHDKHQWWDQ